MKSYRREVRGEKQQQRRRQQRRKVKGQVSSNRWLDHMFFEMMEVDDIFTRHWHWTNKWTYSIDRIRSFRDYLISPQLIWTKSECDLFVCWFELDRWHNSNHTFIRISTLPVRESTRAPRRDTFSSLTSPRHSKAVQSLARVLWHRTFGLERTDRTVQEMVWRSGWTRRRAECSLLGYSNEVRISTVHRMRIEVAFVKRRNSIESICVDERVWRERFQVLHKLRQSERTRSGESKAMKNDR